MKYDYHFSNETISIDIPDGDCDVLIELDRLERNVNQKETRRHVSLESLNLDEDLLPSDADVEASCISQLEEEELRRAMDRLLLRHAELQRTNALLKQQVQELTQERDSLRSRLQAARARIESLLDRLPTSAKNKEQP